MKHLRRFSKLRSTKIAILIAMSFTLVFTVLPQVSFAQNQPTDSSTVQPAENTAPEDASASAAQAINDQDSFEARVDTTVQGLASLLQIVVKFLNLLIWPILFMIGGLMDNSLIFGPGIEDRLYLIWSQIRNLINLLFAIALIGVALYNVTGLGKDGNYKLKTFLPSMVLTLVLVNFSFFGVRLVLDVANVATTAVFALPNSIEQQFSEERILTIEESLCNNESLKGLRDTQNINLGDQRTDLDRALAGLDTGVKKLCDGGILSDNGRSQFRAFNKNNAGLVMAISFNRVADILDPSQLTISNPSFVNLVINLLIVLVMQIVYFSAYFALFAVLVARVIALWVVTIASPLIVLKLGMSKVNVPGLDFLNSFDLESIFINHLTAPIKIGLAMSVGYMMLDAFQTIGSPSVYFPLGDDFTNVFSGVGTINELFIAAVATGIVWTVSFKAADTTFAKAITSKYESWANGLGRSIRDLAIQRTPILPLGTNSDGSVRRISLGETLNKPKSFLDNVNNKSKSETSSNSSKIGTLKNNPGLLMNDSDSSKITNLNKEELKILGSGIAASDDGKYKTQFDRVKKDRILLTLETIKKREAYDRIGPREIDQAIENINQEEGSDANQKSLEIARNLLRREMGSTSRYTKDQHEAKVKEFEEKNKPKE